MKNIQGIYKWFKQFDNKEILIKTKNKNLEIKINKNSLFHLLGLQYINKNYNEIKGKDIIK